MKGLVNLLMGLGSALLVSGCIYPGPEFERYSKTGQPLEGHGILHAYYELADTFDILPSSAKWAVTEIDGTPWTAQMRREAENRIPLPEGLHFVRFEGDYLLDRPYSSAIALEVQPDHEYELAEGFYMPMPFSGDRLKRWDTSVNVIQDGKIIRTISVETIAGRSKSRSTCRTDTECSGGLTCSLLGETGFGMCGSPR